MVLKFSIYIYRDLPPPIICAILVNRLEDGLRISTFFRQKLTTALLESAEGTEWPLKIFHDQSPRKNVADFGGGWTRDLLVSRWTRIQLSHRGRHNNIYGLGVGFWMFSDIICTRGGRAYPLGSYGQCHRVPYHREQEYILFRGGELNVF